MKTKIIKNLDQLRAFFKVIADRYDWRKPLRFDYKVCERTRSQQQNALMWVYYGEIKNHVYETTGQLYSEEDIHEFMKEKFLPARRIEINGEERTVRRSTTKLSVTEMQDYLSKIEMYCAENLHLQLEAA